MPSAIGNVRHAVARVVKLLSSPRVRRLLPVGLLLAIVIYAVYWAKNAQKRARAYRRQREELRQRLHRGSIVVPPGKRPRVVVVGGGVSGLTAAYKIKSDLPDCNVTVLEATERCGGNIQTIDCDAGGETIRIETGPRSLRSTTSASRQALLLMAKLGLLSRIIAANQQTQGRRYVLDTRSRRLEELPSSLGQSLSFGYKHNLLSALYRDLSCALTRPLRRHVSDWPLSGSAFVADLRSAADFAAGLETAHSFASSHFSKHLADRFFTALIHGIFSGSAKDLLIRYIFPDMWQTEAAYGSLILGSLLEPWLKLRSAYNPHVQPMNGFFDESELSREDMDQIDRIVKLKVVSLQGGLQTLIAGLQEACEDLRVQIVTNHRVLSFEAATGRESTASASISTSNKTDAEQSEGGDEPSESDATSDHIAVTVPTDSGDDVDATTVITGPINVKCRAPSHTDDGETDITIEADCVVSTLAPHLLADVLQSSSPYLAPNESPAMSRVALLVQRLQRVKSLSIATITMVYTNTSFSELIPHAQQGFGYLVPDVADRGGVLGIVYDSCVFPGLAGAEHLVLTAMVGGAKDENQRQVETAKDEELIDAAQGALGRVLGARRSPDHVVLQRWLQAIPQFNANYARARTTADEFCATTAPWLFLAGKAFGPGVGVNDCIVSGLQAASAVSTSLVGHK